jgi:hypothetical protein
MAGAGEVGVSFGPVEERELDLCFGSIGGCWSTGKKLHSFFNLMQLTQRP